jgi:hypothetical protein
VKDTPATPAVIGGLSESVTLTEKMLGPGADGVPEITPVAGLRLSPGGRAELAIAQV